MQDRNLGCLFGMAYGDALGAETEFLGFDDILRRFPPKGPQAPDGNPALVTDDTQMALAVGEALASTSPPYSAERLEGPLRRAFVAWEDSPENDRSPGITCLTACARLAMDIPWMKATVADSKGCGANMRVAPVGLLRGVTPKARAAIAQFQAALTHGHPTGLAASDLTAAAIADLAADGDAPGLPRRLREYAHSQRHNYHDDWLSNLWQRPSVSSAEDFIARGWGECRNVLDRLDAALLARDLDADLCDATGAGWIAEEAFATGLLCFLLFPNDPVAAIRHAAVSSGDSNSIACLTGAFAGASCGMGAWPAEWRERIEYRDRLAVLASAL